MSRDSKLAAFSRKLSGFDATEVDSLVPTRSALAGLHPAMRDKFLSPVGFIAPAQSALRLLPLANPFRHFPNGSNPKRLKFRGLRLPGHLFTDPSTGLSIEALAKLEALAKAEAFAKVESDFR
jgi:hypothetical protein